MSSKHQPFSIMSRVCNLALISFYWYIFIFCTLSTIFEWIITTYRYISHISSLYWFDQYNLEKHLDIGARPRNFILYISFDYLYEIGNKYLTLLYIVRYQAEYSNIQGQLRFDAAAALFYRISFYFSETIQLWIEINEMSLQCNNTALHNVFILAIGKSSSYCLWDFKEIAKNNV